MAEYLRAEYDTNGEPVWKIDSPRVTWEVKTRVDRKEAAIEKKRHQDSEKRKNKKTGEIRPDYGRSYYAVGKTVDGGPMPRKQDWIKQQQAKAAKGIGMGGPSEVLTPDGKIVEIDYEAMKAARDKRRAQAKPA